MLQRRTICAVVALLILPAILTAGSDIPMGHKDFYPTEDRPVGFRGDGNGYFPGATPVKVFSSGTPKKVEQKYKDKHGREKTGDYIDIVDDKPRNVVWKTEMPSWANSQPIVVGDRVFTIGEPDWLICADARTGKVLWAHRNSVWSTLLPDEAKAQKLDEMFQIYLSVNAMIEGQFKDRKPRYSPSEFRKTRNLYVDKCMPRNLNALASLDPEVDYKPSMQKMIEGMDLFIADAENYGKAKRLVNGKHSFLRLLKDRIQRLTGKKIGVDLPWGNMIGWCMSTPVSDGKRVYASFGQGHTVCYDLKGRLLWKRFVQVPSGRTDSVQSPLLSGDILVDVHGGAGVLRGLDKETGAIRWTAPTRSDKLKKHKGGYYVGSHKIVRLTDGSGKLMDVVVTTMCNIIRASDGKVMGHLPWEWSYGPSGGPSIFNSGNIVYRSANGDGGASPFTAYELTVTGPDTVSAKMIYHTEKKASPGYHGQVATPEVVIMTARDRNIIDARTGKVLHAGRHKSDIGGLSNILAGDLFLWADQGQRDRFMSSWGSRRADGRCALRFYAADVSDPANPKRVDDRNVLEGENIPRFPPFEKYVPELYDAGVLWGSWNGLPAHFMHTDTAIYPQGNRLFIRSVSHLYCIGDPDEPWHTPAAAPPEARTGK